MMIIFIKEGRIATLDYTSEHYPLFIKSGAIIPLNVDDSVTGHGSDSSKDYITFLIYPNGLSSFQFNKNPSNSKTITCNGNGSNYTISFSKSTDSLIIRLKNNVEPENVPLNGGVNLVKYNSFSDFESASSGSGWFQGKINDNENVYTWIKFSNPADTVYVINSCSLDLYPADYELSNLTEGNRYYIDRPYTITSVPDEYKGFNMIKTRNEDRATVKLKFQFNLCESTDVYIAFDQRLPHPSWLTSNYFNTTDSIKVNDIYLSHFDIWKNKITSQTNPVVFGDNGGDNNSAMYFVFYKTVESVSLNIKVFLQGPYKTASGLMDTTLRKNGILPSISPYKDTVNNSKYLNGGNHVQVTYTIPTNITDWVQIQLRDTVSKKLIYESKSCFLRDDGQVIDPDGLTQSISLGISPGNYYVVVKHRNHLAVMSADKVQLNGITSYDFTTDSTKAYGTSAMVKLGTSTKYGMYAGDCNSSDIITASDISPIASNLNGTTYSNTDVNLSGITTASDISPIAANLNAYSKVPK